MSFLNIYKILSWWCVLTSMMIWYSFVCLYLYVIRNVPYFCLFVCFHPDSGFTPKLFFCFFLFPLFIQSFGFETWSWMNFDPPSTCYLVFTPLLISNTHAVSLLMCSIGVFCCFFPDFVDAKFFFLFGITRHETMEKRKPI